MSPKSTSLAPSISEPICQPAAAPPGCPRPARASLSQPASAERLRRRQRSLVDQYRHDPDTALIRDCGHTDAENTTADGPLDPLHTWVEVGSGHEVSLPVAVHRAVGGLSDLPVPGDLLCAALACCTDSSLRVVSNALAVELQSLSVRVSGEVDVRGALFVSPDVPVAFQRFHVNVFLRAAPGSDPRRLARILATAEHSCVVMQTLRAGVPVTVEYDAEVLPSHA